jgi:transketolase
MKSKASAAPEMERAHRDQEYLDNLCINTIRTLAMDAVQKADSGHPGTPMALAPLAYVLWTKFLRFNPADPKWFNRDRFVLSNGHASMLQYAMLFLTGYDLTLDDLKSFRQWGSKTPGHPEYGRTPGIETTTGPLGQGFMSAVGMTIAEAHLAALFNRPGYDVVNHYTYVFCSDGDLMEGASHEAASIAGHLKLGKLIFVYDQNHISIEGPTEITFTDDVARRFEGYHWHVQDLGDKANDTAAIADAFREAQAETDRPSMIILRSHIAYGAPHMQDTKEAHGQALGEEEVRLTKRAYGWPEDKTFFVPQEVYGYMRQPGRRGQQAEDAWDKMVADYKRRHEDLGRLFEASIRGELPQARRSTPSPPESPGSWAAAETSPPRRKR